MFSLHFCAPLNLPCESSRNKLGNSFSFGKLTDCDACNNSRRRLTLRAQGSFVRFCEVAESVLPLLFRNRCDELVSVGLLTSVQCVEKTSFSLIYSAARRRTLLSIDIFRLLNRCPKLSALLLCVAGHVEFLDDQSIDSGREARADVCGEAPRFGAVLHRFAASY
jgi:hypothetical protein